MTFDAGSRLPKQPLLVSFIATNGAAFAVLAAASLLLQETLALGNSFAWRAALVFGAACALALGSLRTRHPFATFGAANQVTTVRAVLVALIAGLLSESSRAAVAATAACLTLLVCVLDGLDGWLARRTGMTSEFGARFDMEVDALLVMILSLLAYQYGKAGMWVLASGLLRYGFVAASWLEPALARPLFPSRRRQTVCVMQVAGLNLAIAPFVSPSASSMLAAAALGCLGYSFAVDVIWLLQRRDSPVRLADLVTRARVPAVE
jgi:phosphatidylglycerophosphate synthase